MRIEAVDFFYLSMPVVTDEGDGSQDALVVRLAAGGRIGWGECEASPLVSIAAFVTPKSHGACRPVAETVLGQALTGPADIARIAAELDLNSMDLLQTPHTFSGIEMAMWDLLGRVRDEPVWRMLGYARAYPKTPYASMLFGDTAAETLARAREAVAAGFRAIKCGWGPYGRGTVEADADQVAAAREGLGPGGILLVDAGQIWREDVAAAALRLPALVAAGATWLEEPFAAHAYEAYGALAAQSPVALAGGEGAHNPFMARHLIDYGRTGYIQIDCGRIGGIGPAKQVADHAAARGVTYVNHTFTSHLALAASLQPYAGLADHRICEYPVAPKPVALALSDGHLRPDANGEIVLPDRPGLGIGASPDGMRPYLVEVEIRAKGRTLYRTPDPAAARGRSDEGERT
jgi:L-alanine-DL-glutamate epimerase-like enolase superfamily enzyme